MIMNKVNEKYIIINATNIGYKYQGLGVYSLNILKELTKLKTSLCFIVYLNKSARPHLNDFVFPGNFQIKWITSLISPDRKFKGHFLRLLFSNLLSISHPRILQFNTSQLEVNFFKKNQVVTVHDVIPYLFPNQHKKQYHYYNIFLRFGLRNVKQIITPSNHSKELLQNIYNLKNDKIKVIHNGVSDFKTKLHVPDLNKENYIIYIGRVCEMKNIKGILQAFKKISDHIILRLIIIGDEKSYLAQLLDQLKINAKVREQIIYKQNISEDEKISLLSKASALIFPSFYEGFGLPPIEAMACGCPVITSNNSSLPEVCGNAALYINPNNVNEICEKILQLLSKKELMDKLSYSSIKQSEKFSWAISTQNYLNVFERITRELLIQKKFVPVTFEKSKQATSRIELKPSS